jgi:hypothetical protein
VLAKQHGSIWRVDRMKAAAFCLLSLNTGVPDDGGTTVDEVLGRNGGVTGALMSLPAKLNICRESVKDDNEVPAPVQRS